MQDDVSNCESKEEMKSSDEYEYPHIKKCAIFIVPLAILLIAIVGSCFIWGTGQITTQGIDEFIGNDSKNITAIHEAKNNLGIAQMGFIFIITLVAIVMAFVSSNYLVHPTSWCTKMIDRGRTLEYITVILIVGIVLVLSLTGKLLGETVGTILGAIAGYVLGKAVTPKSESDNTKNESE